MKKKHVSGQKGRHHASGRRTCRLLIQGHSAGFVLGDTEALSETLTDIESGRRFARTAVSQCLRTLSHKHIM